MADEIHELGFAEFTAQLIAEVFEAVSSARIDQERQLRLASESASLPLEEFARIHITKEELDAELLRLHPGDTRARSRERKAVQQHLAESRQAELRQLLADGLPRVVVDSGRINAKLTFTTTTVADVSSRGRSTRPVIPLRPLPGALPDPARQIRLLVKNASDTAPQNSTTRADVLGEVEITFKTIT